MDLKNIIEHLEPYQDNDIIKSALEDLRETLHNQRQVIEDLEQEGRMLHIGVIGQVKAGKSSFLNALLFGGRDFLPHAATPMTAALTRLVHAERPRAEFEFYTEEEWRNFEAMYEEYEAWRQSQNRPSSTLNLERRDSAPPPEPDQRVKAAWEVVDLAHQHSLQLSSVRDAKVEEDAEDTEALFQRLADYVGAEGRYTPFVKSVTLYLNQPELRDLVLIDTPGTNDPVVSRGERTREYLKQCDLVFVLSVAGRFLDASDMALIEEHLGNAGISRIILLGSRFDEELIGEYKKYQKLGPNALLAAYKANQEKLGEHARKVLNGSPLDEGRLKALRAALPPRFVSARLHNLGIKPQADWSEAENHTYTQLKKRYPEADLSPRSCRLLGNIEGQKGLLDEARNAKQEIQRRKVADFKAKQATRPLEILEKANENIEDRIRNLKQNDIASLQAGLHHLEERIHSGETCVDDAFDDAIVEMRRRFKELALDIREAGQRIDIRTQSRKETYCSYDPPWYKPWRSKEYSTRTYSTASVQDSIDEIKGFIVQAERDLLEKARNIVDAEKLKKRVITCLENTFDLGDENFDPDQLLRSVRKVVRRINLPDLSIDGDKALQEIIKTFSSRDEVRDSDIDRLRRTQRRAVEILNTEIARQIEAHAKAAEKDLRHQAEQLIENILKDSREDVQQKSRDLENKDASLRGYEEIHAAIHELSEALRRRP